MKKHYSQSELSKFYFIHAHQSLFISINKLGHLSVVRSNNQPTVINITLRTKQSDKGRKKSHFFFELLLGPEPQLDQFVHLADSKSPAIWSRLVFFWISEEWRWIIWLWPWFY
jgi:hypothetical protein